MKKKLFIGIFSVLLAVGIVVSADANKSSSTNLFLIENAEALATECGSGKVVGSPMSGKCNTPMSTENNKKCTTSIITCQGSTNCCERKSCSLH